MVYELFEPYVLPSFEKRPSWASDHGRDEFGVFADLRVGGVIQRFRLINPGTFLMGSPEDEINRMSYETQHEVTISKPFWIGDTPVTQEFWEEVMGGNPSHHKGPQNPVEMVSWYDCENFCSGLQSLFPGTMLFGLPTEAEWEYSCRAGTTEATYAKSLGCGIGDIAWYFGNSNSQTHPVKQKIPNPWGLYDMLGNVWEWCGKGRYIRGGSYNNPSTFLRSSNRHVGDPFFRFNCLGLRLIIDF